MRLLAKTAVGFEICVCVYPSLKYRLCENLKKFPDRFCSSLGTTHYENNNTYIKTI